jgi:hypothetical protein
VELCDNSNKRQWHVRSCILESQFVGYAVPAVKDTKIRGWWSRFAAETAWTICGGGVPPTAILLKDRVVL